MSRAEELAKWLDGAYEGDAQDAAAELRRLSSELAECKAAYESQFKELHALKASIGEPVAVQLWCETCQGIGFIDERLGGFSFNNPKATCPDCAGNGYVTSTYAPAEPQTFSGPVHFRALLDAAQIPHQLKTSMHVVGFRTMEAAEQFVAEQTDFYGWRYTVEPLYSAPVTQAKPEQAQPAERKPLTTELVDYILQDDIHNRLTPRVVDIAYSAFMIGRSGKNKDDGGPCDWYNDTKPMVTEQLAKIRKELNLPPTE